MDRKEIIKEIEYTSPALADLKEHVIDYDVPSDYFMDISDQILEKSEIADHKEPSKLRYLLPYAAVAASIALLISAHSYVNSSNKTINSSIYYDYVMNNIDEYEEENLIEIGLSNVDLNSPLLRISDKAIDDYLMDEDYLFDLDIQD